MRLLPPPGILSLLVVIAAIQAPLSSGSPVAVAVAARAGPEADDTGVQLVCTRLPIPSAWQPQVWLASTLWDQVAPLSCSLSYFRGPQPQTSYTLSSSSTAYVEPSTYSTLSSRSASSTSSLAPLSPRPTLASSASPSPPLSSAITSTSSAPSSSSAAIGGASSSGTTAASAPTRARTITLAVIGAFVGLAAFLFLFIACRRGAHRRRLSDEVGDLRIDHEKSGHASSSMLPIRPSRALWLRRPHFAKIPSSTSTVAFDPLPLLPSPPASRFASGAGLGPPQSYFPPFLPSTNPRLLYAVNGPAASAASIFPFRGGGGNGGRDNPMGTPWSEKDAPFGGGEAGRATLLRHSGGTEELRSYRDSTGSSNMDNGIAPPLQARAGLGSSWWPGASR